MLTREQNEALTRVGPGTPMGQLMRRYWIPALLSWELPAPDCPPVEVRLLGEDLVAFRQTDGQVGLVSAYCAHRRVSLFWGRNEEQGLRCVYHGWKFDIAGRCVDMPSEPAASNFKDRVRIPAYPTYEAGGVTWAYMGPPDKQPAAPLFQWARVGPENRALSKVWQPNNWLQALEGGIDTVHSNFLHTGKPPGLRYDETDPRGRANNYSTAPTLEVMPTDYGYIYAGIRDMGAEGTNHVRGYHWIMPWTQLRGYARDGAFSNSGHMWVPIDDDNTMVYNWSVVFEEPREKAGRSQRGIDDLRPEAGMVERDYPVWFQDARRYIGGGNEFGEDVDPYTFRAVRNRDNRYLIDREAQRNQTYTGIIGTNTQDRAVQESMGRIADRSLERLGTTDRAIIAARRYLLQALETVAAGGDPPGVAATYYNLRAYETVLPKTTFWFDAMKPHLMPEPEQATATV
jgi:phenylpropionate dioxygenase-like ring-hydroxylating dioxygenase large terminal subunit